MAACPHNLPCMYILTRYVVGEVLKFFLAALLVLTLLVTVGMGAREALNRGLPPQVILRTMPYMLPEILGITLPVAMLYAVSSVFGRMTGSNEIVALKSLGISPMAAIWPVIVLAGFLSLGTVWMYELAATWCRPSVQRIAYESLEEIAYSRLQKVGSYDNDQFAIAVRSVEGRKLIRPTITIKGQPGRPTITLMAAEAELRTDWKNRMLRIICRQGEVDITGQMRVSFPDEQHYSIPLAVPPPPPYHRDWVAMSRIPILVAELQNRLQTLQRGLESLRRARRILGEPDPPEEDAKIAEYQHLISQLRAESYRRWANGFTCLFFTLLGVPTAMLRRHADVLTNFFLCFLPILVLYYPLLMFGEDLATSGTFPPASFWIGNVVLAVPAIVLLRWNLKH